MPVMFSNEIGGEARVAERAVHDAMVTANREMFWPATLLDCLPCKGRKRAMRATLGGLMAGQLAARLARPREDWPSDMLARMLGLHLADRAAWSLATVRDECMTAFLAGQETTAATLMSGDAISEKPGTDCKGFFNYFCHSGHSEVTEKVKIFG